MIEIIQCVMIGSIAVGVWTLVRFSIPIIMSSSGRKEQLAAYTCYCDPYESSCWGNREYRDNPGPGCLRCMHRKSCEDVCDGKTTREKVHKKFMRRQAKRMLRGKPRQWTIQDEVIE